MTEIKYPEEIKADGISRTLKLSELGKLATLKSIITENRKPSDQSWKHKNAQ